MNQMIPSANVKNTNFTKLINDNKIHDLVCQTLLGKIKLNTWEEISFFENLC